MDTVVATRFWHFAIVMMALADVDVARAQALLGYTAANSANEARIEARFKAIPSATAAQQQLRVFTAEPHLAGSKRNNDLAHYIADQWRKQGLTDVVLRRYDVYTSEPGEISLEMVEPVTYRASLREAVYSQDPDTANPAIRSAWIGMSGSGDITAPVIYAHSGNPEDFALLRRNGIDVRGKIVLVRYSEPYSYRGFKAFTAEQEGAAAILIYSDPAEDGYARGKVFPDGPWGPETHFQRGAIEYDYPQIGDPTTPGWPSLPGAFHIPSAQAAAVPKIMALPLSWQDGKPLLENMDGPQAPPEWQGALPIRYHLGGERVKVHLKIKMTESLKPNYVVEGSIRGTEQPDEWVLMGNHRDALEFGAADPGSGTAAMMEMTRGLGALAKQGIRPRRTIRFLSWDGEETSFAGSGEWAEQFAPELAQKAVAYVNSDVGVSGRAFEGNSTGSFAALLVDVSKSLRDPSGRTLYESWRLTRATNPAVARTTAGVADFDLTDTHIGSGSDYAALLDRAGVPVIDVSFTGPYGVYHSAYDNFYWMSHFGDPGFRYHAALAQLLGVLVLRIANADVLPYDFGGYGAHIRGYLEELGKATDLSKLQLDGLRDAIDDFESSGGRMNAAVQAALTGSQLDPLLVDQINRAMMSVERRWLIPEGIPGRPGYKHMLYACRKTYAHLELPGLTEAAESGDVATAQQQADILARALHANAHMLNQWQQELACSAGLRGPSGSLCVSPTLSR